MKVSGPTATLDPDSILCLTDGHATRLHAPTGSLENVLRSNVFSGSIMRSGKRLRAQHATENSRTLLDFERRCCSVLLFKRHGSNMCLRTQRRSSDEGPAQSKSGFQSGCPNLAYSGSRCYCVMIVVLG